MHLVVDRKSSKIARVHTAYAEWNKSWDVNKKISYSSKELSKVLEQLIKTQHRYWLFAGECYYAKGGMNDLVRSYKSLRDANDGAKSIDEEEDWWQIMDSKMGVVVMQSTSQAYGNSA